MNMFSKNKFSEKNGNVYIFENSFNFCHNRRKLHSNTCFWFEAVEYIYQVALNNSTVFLCENENEKGK